MPEPPRTYTYAQLAERIAAELGIAPAASTLRAARAEGQRAPGTRPRSRPRITAAMPAPLPSAGRTAVTLFDAEQVEAWLAAHPWRAHDRAVATYRAALASNAPAEQAVAAALGAGLTWKAVAAGLREVRGDTRETKGIYAALRHLQAPGRP